MQSILRLSSLIVAIGLVTTTVSVAEDGASRPPFLRGMPCDPNVCPVEPPQFGDLCCYDSDSACEFDFIYLWASDCSGVMCRPLSWCSCVPGGTFVDDSTKPTKKSKGKKKVDGQWACAIARRNLEATAPTDDFIVLSPPESAIIAPQECETDEKTADLAALIGTTCTPTA